MDQSYLNRQPHTHTLSFTHTVCSIQNILECAALSRLWSGTNHGLFLQQSSQIFITSPNLSPTLHGTRLTHARSPWEISNDFVHFHFFITRGKKPAETQRGGCREWIHGMLERVNLGWNPMKPTDWKTFFPAVVILSVLRLKLWFSPKGNLSVVSNTNE